jgi:hypothetical protein
MVKKTLRKILASSNIEVVVHLAGKLFKKGDSSQNEQEISDVSVAMLK